MSNSYVGGKGIGLEKLRTEIIRTCRPSWVK